MKHISFEVTPDQVAVITINCQGTKVNKVSSELLTEIDSMLTEIESNKALRGVVVMSGKSDNFVVGADIDEVKAASTKEAAEDYLSRGHAVLNRLAALRIPKVAAIHGNCLGGGLELALIADYRIASDSTQTQMGLPEVQIGLLPAAGGTHRLPRLIGLRAAMPLMLTGKSIRVKKAKQLGLVDKVVIPYGMREVAITIALDLAKKKFKRKRKRSFVDAFLESSFGRGVVFTQATKMVMKQTHGLYPAPLSIIESVRRGYKVGVVKGMTEDVKRFGALAVSPQAKALMTLFFNMTDMKKNPSSEKPRPVGKLAVMGAGLMGQGIAAVSLGLSDTVLLKDVSVDAAAAGMKQIHRGIQKRVKSGALRRFDGEALYGKVVPCDDYSMFKNTGMVIEAVFEDLGLKQRVLADVEAATGDSCIFASNTSALPIGAIAEKAARPQNVIGMHYFSPVPQMPLLEIITTPKTAEWVVSTARDYGTKQGKTCIVVKDGPGFYTTRILAPLLNEAVVLVEEGADIHDIDRAMHLFGYPVGPITLIDEVGIDVGAHVSKGLGEAFASRGMKSSSALPALLEKGYKGKKNKKGFYRYDVPKKKGVRASDPDIYRLVGNAPRKKFDFAEIQQRVSLMMVNEAALCLQEGIIAGPRDGDVGAILGLGFPPFRGGPFRHVDSAGAGEIVRIMNGYQERLGARFAPAKILEDMAGQNKKFYP
ncbi:MAG: fatty acid oxidation complex subunit alpha FadJ [Spirochaetes bacterium]|nr:MAG: fatty acid oxidation complex subunit alpha FadJ [Spirochaetota bacterium]